MASIINSTTTAGVTVTGDNSGSLQLATNNGNTAVTIDTSQNVGIGTSSPSSIVEAAKAAGNTQIRLTESSDSGSDTALFYARRSRGTSLSSPTAIQSGNNMGGLAIGAYNGTAYAIGSRIIGVSNQTWTGSAQGTYLTFSTTADGATSDTERMRITSTGQLGLGVTPSGWGGTFKTLQIGRGSYSADGNSNLQVSMNAYYNGSDWKYISANRASNIYADLSGSINTRTTNTVGTVDGSISWTDGPYLAAGGTSWTSSSDENLKNITGEIDDALNKVNQLRAAKFTWKADAENTPQVGLIAQDLQNVLPECVVVPDEKINPQDNPKFLGVNYDQVIPLLVAAIQELKAELDATKAEVQALKGVA